MKYEFNENDKANFIKVCNESISMASACKKLKMSHNTFIKYAKKFGCYNPNPGLKGTHKKSPNPAYPLEDILNGKYPNYSTYKLKIKLLNANIKKDECEECGWCKKRENEKYSACELHHIDGNNKNHKLSNLKMLCPNCHSLTTNYRSKNRAHK